MDEANESDSWSYSSESIKPQSLRFSFAANSHKTIQSYITLTYFPFDEDFALRIIVTGRSKMSRIFLLGDKISWPLFAFCQNIVSKYGQNCLSWRIHYFYDNLITCHLSLQSIQFELVAVRCPNYYNFSFCFPLYFSSRSSSLHIPSSSTFHNWSLH